MKRQWKAGKILTKREKKILKIAEQYIYTDGAHHKQWALQEIGKILGVRFYDCEEGIPD